MRLILSLVVVWLAAVPAAAQQVPNPMTRTGSNADLLTLVARAAGSTATVTVTIASPAVVTWASHGFSHDTPTPVYFTTTGALPTGISANTTYWTIPGVATTNNTFQIASSITNALAATAVNTSGSQSGVQTGVNAAKMTSAAAKSVLGMSLTPGKWECWGASRTIPAATTTQSTNTTSISAALDTILSAEDGGEPQQYSAPVPANSTIQQSVGMTRVTVPPATPIVNSCLLVSGTTTNCLMVSGSSAANPLLVGTSGGGGSQTMYLVNNTVFATDILSVAGRLNCRRWG